MAQFTRQTAHKVYIADLLGGKYTKGLGEFDPAYLEVRGIQVSRANLVGIVVSVSGKEGYSEVMIDDGTASVSLRAWADDSSLLEGLTAGNVICAIGRIKMFNDTVYLLPETCQVLNPSWLKLRRLELSRKYGEPMKVEKFDIDDIQPPVEDEPAPEDVNGLRTKIMSFIDEKDQGDGVDLEAVVASCGSDSEKVVQELLKDGEVFEVKMGKLRILP